MLFPSYIVWRPGIGDPDVFGWLTTVAYAVASGACLRAARSERERQPSNRQRSRVWTVFALVLLVLGINKQLDCQTLAIQVGRHLALVHNWYAYRRLIEKAVAVAVAAAGLVAIARLRGVELASPRVRFLGLAGASLLVVFLVVRAWPVPESRPTAGQDRIGFHWYTILELGGIGCLGAASLRREERGAKSEK